MLGAGELLARTSAARPSSRRSITTRPSASATAVSIDCARRVRRSGFITSRSTTTSIVCLNFLSRTMSSSSRRCSPSTFTRVKPSRRSSSKTSRYSPLRSRTTGALTVNRVPSGRRSTWSTIASIDWPAIGRPQTGQCGRPDARVQQAQVVVDLGHGADRRARVAARRLLVDRDRRAEAVDRVDVRLLHHLEELARVGGERLDVAPLALRVDRVEGQARLAGAREPGDGDERVPRQRDGDVLEVVLAGAVDDEGVCGHRGQSSYRTCVRQRAIDRPACPGFGLATVMDLDRFGCRWRRALLRGGGTAADTGRHRSSTPWRREDVAAPLHGQSVQSSTRPARTGFVSTYSSVRS